MAEPHIALLRKGGNHLLALTRVGADNRWWATAADGKPFRITRQQIVWETDVAVLDSGLAQWLVDAEGLAVDTNLEEAWNLVHGEVPGLSLSDLAELVWSSPVEGIHLGAMLLCLFTTPLRYFQPDGETLVPLTEEAVAQQIEKQGQQQMTADEESSFITWLGGSSDIVELTPRQLAWVETLRQYAFDGDSSTAAKAAKGWLRQIQQSQDPQRLAFDLLVRQGELDEDEFFTLRKLGVPKSFSDETLEDAERLAGNTFEPSATRRDLTDVAVFTIDEASTVDIDDGLSMTRMANGYEVGIHITDAAALIPTAGLVEDAARERMTSMYLPEATLHMLPRQLAEAAGSLVPEGTRPAISLLAQIDDAFQLQSWELCRSLVRSVGRLSYEEADAALIDSTQPYGEQLQKLSKVAEPLHEASPT